MKNQLNFQLHPWHGIEVHSASPQLVQAFIEILPTDTVKYEVDKISGFLKVDRPQKFSNVVPALYGFIPRTYCDKRIAKYCEEKSGIKIRKGDGDPLDILVLTEKVVDHRCVLIESKPIGGLRMIDNGEADDKIIAVMKNDPVYGSFNELSDCSSIMIDRIVHYFLTYKNMPGEERNVQISHRYSAAEAREVIRLSTEDYFDTFS